MTKDKRVLVGMSGGIDSSAACIMLQEQGCRRDHAHLGYPFTFFFS